MANSTKRQFVVKPGWCVVCINDSPCHDGAKLVRKGMFYMVDEVAVRSGDAQAYLGLHGVDRVLPAERFMLICND